MDFAVPADHMVKLKESEKRYEYLDFTRQLKTMEHESDGYTNYNGCTWYSHQIIGIETSGLGNKRTIGNHRNYSLLRSARIVRRVLET